MNSRDLDNHITGHYGEDQFKLYCEQCGKQVKLADEFSMTIAGNGYAFCSSGCMGEYAKENL